MKMNNFTMNRHNTYRKRTNLTVSKSNKIIDTFDFISSDFISNDFISSYLIIKHKRYQKVLC